MTYPDYDLLKRLELIYAQMRTDFHYRNAWWFYNGEPVGFGDLNDDDIGRIAKKLHDGEEFVGWDERHGTAKDQLGNVPMVRIGSEFIALREDVEKEKGGFSK